jgi:hypothetical protein
MTRQEAEDQAGQRNREHPDRATNRWMARDGAEGWEVVRVAMPAGMGAKDGKPGVEARPRPPQAPDPRPAAFRDIGGPYAGG